jgi:3-hydroxyacyl-[acyl-carrier-protein] dehydratase
MHFSLIDRVIERGPARLVAYKHVSSAEEYLQDHFPTFPVLPGVFMLEAMVQAARLLVGAAADGTPMVLGGVRALKYGRFVSPGGTLRVSVDVHKALEGGAIEFKGEGVLLDHTGAELGTAVHGRFTLRPARVG